MHFNPQSVSYTPATFSKKLYRDTISNTENEIDQPTEF